ncbi:hypothetical protein Cch01nite_41710 [Cellulomonas chitinilytica]|uniref:DUF4235 domain-containing protein n=2 Tax=Cellulomonas chitinilytica TaxID=398759 RepID=A0A919P7A7_9CELL|nr:hypothetical protein Cch01nite_41710 [Cellulomonas chitinilytica]
MVAKIAGAAVTILAAMVARQVVNQAWKAFAGRPAPQPDNADDDSSLGELVAAAAAMGAVVGVSRVLATRGTTRYVAKIERKRRTDPL